MSVKGLGIGGKVWAKIARSRFMEEGGVVFSYEPVIQN